MKINKLKRREFFSMELNEGNLTYNLKLLRHIFELSQSKVAEMLGLERSTYSYYEVGKTQPSARTLIKLAKIYNVPLDYLLSSKINLEFLSKPLCQLSSKEQEVLLLVRLLNSTNQDATIKFLQNLLKSPEDS